MRHLFFYISVVFVILLLAHYMGFLSALENFLRWAGAPIVKTAYQIEIKTKNLSAGYFGRQNIYSENDQCQAKLKQLYLDQTEFVLLREENKTLRAEADFAKVVPKKVVAEIIGRGADNASKSVIINRGEERGLAIGDPVIVEDGFLLGKITRVEKNNAVVRLIIDNQSKIAASVTNQDKTQGLVEGEHGLNIKMKMIPQSENVQVGDIIITSGGEKGIPRGLIIGKVESIQKELYEPFQSANLRPLIDLNKASIVTVLQQQ
ncbi:MAG: rod shape-determining protein MreC [Patescibacteria group bacterium]